MTRARAPNAVQWTLEADTAFRTLQSALCGDPVLAVPCFENVFILQTDATEVRLRAVLSQKLVGEEHRVLSEEEALTK